MMGIGFYTLNGKEPVYLGNDAAAFVEMSRWRDESWDRCQLAHDEIGKAAISTVFLCWNHSLHRDTLPPLLFETMVFGGAYNHAQQRYATFDEAMAGHAVFVAQIRQQTNGGAP
jgi:hypothetical protein